MLLSRIETTLFSQFKQKWQSNVNNSSKCFYYRMYKTDHRFDKYFDIIDGKLLRSFVNFRMCNNVLPIEKVVGYDKILPTENVLYVILMK